MELERIDSQVIEDDYIYRVVQPTNQSIGRGGRAGKLKKLSESNRTFHGLQDLSQKDPTTEFCVWWELLHSEAENRDAIKQGKEELREEKARKRKIQQDLQKEIIAERTKKKQVNAATLAARQNPPTQRVETHQARKRAPFAKTKS
jgi:hypothetical protein